MPPRRISRLLFRLNGDGWTADRPRRVFVVAADGSAPPRPVTPGPFEASGLAWSPDSATIAFAAGRHEQWDLDLATDLWTVPADGRREPERVTGGGRGWSWPAWSPDGTALAAYLDPTPLESPRHQQVAVIDLASGTEQVLTAALDRNCAPFSASIAPIWAGDAAAVRRRGPRQRAPVPGPRGRVSAPGAAGGRGPVDHRVGLGRRDAGLRRRLGGVTGRAGHGRPRAPAASATATASGR